MAIRKRASRVVYENRWMRVREDRIERPDGSPGLYGVVEKGDAVLVIPVDGQGFWLVEQERYPVGGRYWEFPQGTWEGEGAATAEQAALAELREETGLGAGSLTRIGYLYEAYGFCDQGTHVFVATDLTQGDPERGEEEQDMIARRVPVESFEDMVLSGGVRDAASVAAYTLLTLTRSRSSG